MVFIDLFSASSDSTNSSHRISHERFALAKPNDRFAAFVLDSLIVLPIISLIIAPIRRKQIISSLVDDFESLFMQWLFIIIIGFFIVIIYNGYFLTKFKATPGKLFFKLKVVSIWNGNSLTWHNSLMRSTVWWLDFWLGIPMLALWLDRYRRPFHDRISDSIVVAVPHKSSGAPTQNEKSIASGFLISSIFCLFILFYNNMISFISFIKNEDISFLNGSDSAHCSEVVGARKKWLNNNSGLNFESELSYLDIAMSLYAAEAINSKCLNTEANWAFIHSSKSSLPYLAKALTILDKKSKLYKSSDKTSDKSSDKLFMAEEYLNKTCQIDQESDACELSKIIQLINKDKLDVAMVHLNNVLKKSAVQKEATDHNNMYNTYKNSYNSKDGNSIFFKIWSIRYLFDIKQFEHVLININNLPSVAFLSFFISDIKAKSLWELGRIKEARAVAITSLEERTFKEGFELTKWFCKEELKASCQNRYEKICRFFAKSTANSNINDLNDSQTLLTYVSLKECDIALTDSFKELQRHKAFWQDIHYKSFIWKPLGSAIMKRFWDMHQFEEVVSVGTILWQKEQLSPQLKKILIVASNKTGNTSLLTKIQNANIRNPTSLKENED